MKIEILYPEFGNLFADMANMTYLKKCLPEAEFIETNINDKPHFVDNEVNMIYLGSLTEKSQEIVIQKLLPFKEKLEELIENNVIMLFTGNALEVLGKYIENEDGTKIEAVGLFDIYAKRDMLNRKNYTILGKFEDIEIVGYKSLFTEIYGDNEDCYFAEVQVGIGINKDTKFEGIHKNRFIGTHIIGPLLVQNPLLTKKILEWLGMEDTTLYIEEELMEAYNFRVEEYKRKFV